MNAWGRFSVGSPYGEGAISIEAAPIDAEVGLRLSIPETAA